MWIWGLFVVFAVAAAIIAMSNDPVTPSVSVGEEVDPSDPYFAPAAVLMDDLPKAYQGTSGFHPLNNEIKRMFGYKYTRPSIGNVDLLTATAFS